MKSTFSIFTKLSFFGYLVLVFLFLNQFLEIFPFQFSNISLFVALIILSFVTKLLIERDELIFKLESSIRTNSFLKEEKDLLNKHLMIKTEENKTLYQYINDKEK